MKIWGFVLYIDLSDIGAGGSERFQTNTKNCALLR
jgi:hypothetical protein